MKIQEAIEILTYDQKDRAPYPTDIIGKAERLGIEALRRLQGMRDNPTSLNTLLLPGETED